MCFPWWMGLECIHLLRRKDAQEERRCDAQGTTRKEGIAQRNKRLSFFITPLSPRKSKPGYPPREKVAGAQ